MTDRRDPETPTRRGSGDFAVRIAEHLAVCLGPLALPVFGVVGLAWFIFQLPAIVHDIARRDEREPGRKIRRGDPSWK